MKALITVLILINCSCRGQNAVSLTFVNRSQFDIDSIVIRYSNTVTFEKLSAGQQYSKRVKDIRINSGREGTFPLIVYLNGQTFRESWGFHDFGRVWSASETFYIFNNGISRIDKNLEKPSDFSVFFYNASSQSLDSIIDYDNSIRSVKERTPRSFEVVFDYSKIEKTRKFGVIMSGEMKSVHIDHDFRNWNYSQANFHYENDSLRKGPVSWKEPLEFIVHLDVKLQIPADSLRIISEAVVKTYYLKQPNSVQIVFDFKKLRQRPAFIVKSPLKEYAVDLSSHDFSNFYSNQVIYYLEERGIRSLME